MQQEDPHFEPHRPFVREINDGLASWYGYGGGTVVVIGASIIVVAYLQHAIGEFATWMVCITMMLIALYGLRIVIARRKKQCVERVAAYNDVNALKLDHFVTYFQGTGSYPFFSDLCPGT